VLEVARAPRQERRSRGKNDQLDAARAARAALASDPLPLPRSGQRALFGVLAPIARWRGYRATYQQLSRTVLAPRE
jgi:hypothetical protein